MGITKSHLSESTTCPFCGARLLPHESSDFCCLNGRISLPAMAVPPELLSFYNDETEVGRHFRQHIRMYNHIFAFTSMGVHLDGDLANGREGVYSFRAQEAIYHKIGVPRTIGSLPLMLTSFNSVDSVSKVGESRLSIFEFAPLDQTDLSKGELLGLPIRFPQFYPIVDSLFLARI
ncbi:uncharacterized protein G2W53_003730 [Senna tora]|uniref:Uncharacterized protein n=1 Tax=Senna tora TaxID=362788 RepID=A0A834XBL2_9FABA|nr:uncharacterized protein G2W53_003730 [Senna tora]